VILIGETATTTTGNIFEVLGNTKLGGALLVTGSTTLQNFTAINSTTNQLNFYLTILHKPRSNNATTTNLFSTTASTTNLFATAVTAGLYNGQNIGSQAIFTGTLTVTSGLTTLSNLFLTGSTTLQNFTALLATTTSATSTEFLLHPCNSRPLAACARAAPVYASST